MTHIHLRSIVACFCSLACLAAALWATPSLGISPNNPYRSFNLSGINYGSMQWERAQRQGKQVWPYYNTPGRNPGRGGAIGGWVGSGGGSGAIIQGAAPRTAPRVYRRWRRR